MSNRIDTWASAPELIQQWLKAATEVLAENGYGGFTIDAVARHSGVARSTIYRHWQDRPTLIAAPNGLLRRHRWYAVPPRELAEAFPSLLGTPLHERR